MLDEIPVEVRAYLSAGDSIGHLEVTQKYPNVERTLASPEVRAAILRYLRSDEAWKEPNPGFMIGALTFLQGAASAKELPAVQGFVVHRNPWVRVRAYEYMMAVYYPAGDSASMVKMFEKMLVDPDEVVRVQAARWIQGVGVVAAMRGYLQNWIQRAPERMWDHQESFTIIQELLR